MTSFEHLIRALTKPRSGTYPRPWTTDTDPEKADILIVGASSAKTFHVADVGDHDQFIDALWNRNGRTCRAMYDAATTKPSKTRPNLDKLSEMLAAHGLTSLQTNVSCASARYDADISEEDRAHGTEIFKAVVAHVPWRALIVYGVGASERFGRAFDVSMPPVPLPDSPPVRTKVYGRDVFVSPTLAPPRYRTSVWPYLERVVAILADNIPPAEASIRTSISRPEPMQEKMSPSTPVLPQDTAQPDLPEGFCNSAANQLVWRRMHAIEAVTGLTVKPSTQQAALTGG